MIYKVYADNKNFNNVEFKKGLNIVLGVKTETSNDNDTMNGVGKTTLLEIIDFCLGSKIDKNSYLKKIEKIQEWTFSIEMDIFDSVYTISRSIEYPNKIYIEGNLNNLLFIPEKENKQHYFKLNDWKKYLGLYLFNLNSHSDFSPSFRSLISYFLRKRSESFIKPFEHHSKQLNWDVQVNNAYLLGLNWKCASNFQSIKESLKEINKSLKKFDKITLGEMETKKINLENELFRKNENLSSFKIHENYNEIENLANQLSDEISYLSNDNMVLKRKLNNYLDSVTNEEPPKNDSLNHLYHEINDMFNLKTKKTLNDVRMFHNNLIKNRKSFLNVEILQIKDEIKNNEKLIEKKDNERSKLMKILDTNNALDEFKLLQEQIYDDKIKLNEIKSYIDEFHEINQNKKDINSKKNILKEKNELEYEINRNYWEESIKLFNENTKFLYGLSGELIINLKEAYDFKIKFPKNDSRGISKMEIFCYDIMLLERNSKEKNIDFLIHDSEIFSDVDSRQVAKALQLAQNKCNKHNLQYIFTLNSDELEKIKLELNDDLKLDEFIRLELLDNVPDKHLLGFEFD